MTEAIKWWNNLPTWRKKKLAEEEQWTTPDQLSDYQIELIYKATQSY